MKFLFKIIIFIAIISFSFKGYSQLTLDDIAVTDVTDCYGGSDGTITILVSGGQTPYEYSVDGGVVYQAGNAFGGLPTGGYSVYVKDFFNQVVSDYRVINEPDIIFIENEEKTDVIGCFGDANGTITITASGGTGNLTYFIDNGTIFSNTTGIFTGLIAGTYSVYVRDENLCQINGFDIIVGQPSELLITSEDVTDIIGCPGSANGSINFIVSGGTGDIDFSIDNGVTFEEGPFFFSLVPGDYYSAVIDSEGCTTYGDSVLTITEPPVIVIDSQVPTHVTGCYNNDNGEIEITAHGGSGTLYYSIDGVSIPIDNGGDFTNLFAGTYNVYVVDDFGCGVTGNEIILTQPSEIIIDSVSKTDILNCFGDLTGTFTINAHGGSILEYCVEPGLVWQDSKTITNLAAGLYTPWVRDKNDPTCIISGTSLLIEEPQLLTVEVVITTNVSTCTGGDDGRIQITTNGGGTPGYQFSIDGGATYPYTNDIPGLTAGIYDVYVQDTHNCIDHFTTHVVEIGEPTPVIITNEVPTDPICYGGTTGSIDVTASGGTGSILYSPNGGLNFYTGNILSGLSADIPYSIVVEDANGCQAIGSTITLGQPDSLQIDSIVEEHVTNCYGGSNGSIVIYAIGGTAPIQYSIDSEVTYQLSNTFIGLGQSSNHIVIMDDKLCKTDGGVIAITEPDPVLITSQSSIDVIGCNGDTNGEIHIVATGGTPDLINGFQFSINGSPFAFNNGDYTGLAAGDYDIIVSDINNCTANVNTITIHEPTILIADTLSSYKELKCFGDVNGFISMSGSGGQFPYQFSNDNGATYQTASFFSGLPIGIYQTYVRDSYNCEQIGPEVIITQPSLLEILSPVAFENVDGCFGDDDGTITITASGGTPGYMYTVNLGSTWYNNVGAFTNLSPGDYFVKIRDANFCEATYLDINSDLDTITITEPDLLEITSLSKEDFDCFGDDTGEIHIGATGGTGVLEYFIVSGTYNDSNNSGDFINLPAEDYTVHVEDENACSSQTYPISIYEPPELVINNVESTDETCPGANDGTITIFAGGGTWPYDYSADDITYQHNNRTIENLAPGDYTAYIFDTNNCDTTWGASITIAPASFTSIITADVTIGCSPLTVNFSRLNEGVTQSWKFGDGTFSGLPEPEHIFENLTSSDIIYTVTAYSESPAPGYCEDSVQMYITVYPQAQLLFTAAPQVSFYPDATITLTNYSPGMTDYLWDFGDGNTTTDENPGTHTYDDCGEYIINLSAVNSFSCPGSFADTIIITAYQPQAFFEVDTIQHCTPFSFNFENQSTYTESFEWVLDDGTIITDNSFSNFYETPGDYTITLNAFGYCDTYDSYDTTITVFQSPIVDFDVFPDTVMLPDQPIRCINNSSEDGELFFWDFGDGGTSTEENPMYQYTAEGSYPIQLTVVSINKCIDSLTYLTEVIVLPEGEALFPNAFTPNGDGENDVFKPAVYYSVESFKMEIYNRWGELVFYTEDINNGWTGFYDGQLSLQDVYVWRAEGIYLNGTPFIFAGSVTLLR